MMPMIINEYTTLLRKKANIEAALSELPRGYISKKNIGGKEYRYLQARVHGKVTSTYLKSDEVEAVIKKLSLRKEYESALPVIAARLGEIEKAANILDASLARRLDVLKLSIGMDELPKHKKQICISFSDAMTAIEGVQVSAAARRELDSWKNGDATFLSVFENTLKRYGFPVEGK